MAITTPAGIQISKDYQLLVPAMAKQPLQRALENLNYLWKFHRPALVDVCPNVDLARGGHTMVYPIAPSADGLRYDFEHRIMPTANSNCAITVDYTTAYAGGGTDWVNIYAVNPATTANTLLTHNDASLVIPATAVALRVDYLVAAGNIAPQHILIHPAPSNAVAGIQASGFTPFDNGLLVGQTGAPVHTEYLNRCKISALSLLRDRRQQVLSFLQRDAGVPWSPCPPAAPVVDYTQFQDLPAVRVFLPFQGPDATIAISALADVDAGGTANLISVRQVGVPDANQATFAANGAINTANLVLHLQGQGLDRYADLAIGAKITASNNTYLRAVSAYWRPGD